MISVAGEALIDLLPGDGDSLIPHVGGAPFNVARLVARLGQPATFLGGLSDDPYGRWLAEELNAAGVALAVRDLRSAATPVAIAQLDATGSAQYRFYFEATAGAALAASDIPGDLLARSRALALGGLGIVYEPVRSTLLELVAVAPAELTIVLDPNCRPSAIGDLDAYRATIRTLLARTDLLKLSAEDAAFLMPGSTVRDAAVALLAQGPAVVLVTDGPHAVLVVTPDEIHSVPVTPGPVVDTVGAGDAFLAGILAWLAAHPELDVRALDVASLVPAVTAAVQVAGAVCSMAGATLPPDFVWRDQRPGDTPLQRVKACTKEDASE